jgi:tetratricopeptide (TPR) repeat protein
MEKISDALPVIAQEAGVSVIVSKWEVTYKSPPAEVVDLTPQLVALFDPSEETLKIVEDMKTIDPVPIDQMLVQDIDEERKQSIAEVVRAVIDERGVDAGIEHYRELREAALEEYNFAERELNQLGYHYLGKEEYNFAERELNQLGYHYLGNGETEIAIEIFKLNVEIYPDAFNTYDSLGEGYMEAGQNELAIQNYERSLELNPGNDNARQMLGRMGVEDEG